MLLNLSKIKQKLYKKAAKRGVECRLHFFSMKQPRPATNHILLLKVRYGIINVPILNLPCYTSLKAQPTYWKYRDRGTDFFTGFKPIKNVFLVPSLKSYNTFL